MAVLRKVYRWVFICAFFPNLVEGAVPRFTPPIWFKSLPEVTTKAGTYLQQFNATDTDGDPITYSLQTEAKEWLSINSTNGRTWIIKTLDREALSTGRLDIEVYADANGDRETMRVILIVTDVNDNAPAFQILPTSIAIKEDTSLGFTLFAASATDADEGSNKLIAYNISNGNQWYKLKEVSTFVKHPRALLEGLLSTTQTKFRVAFTHQRIPQDHLVTVLAELSPEGRFTINSVSGAISLVKSLDYDDGTRTYNLNITATNDRSNIHLQSFAILTINVTDVDDLYANFSQPIYKVHIDKNSPKGSFVTQVSARDMDSFNDPVTYGIYPESDPSGIFMINSTTGIITVNGGLQDNIFSLTVTATSTKHPPGFALVKVTVGPKPNLTYIVSIVEGEANIEVYNLQLIESYFNVSGATLSLLGNYGSQFVIDDATSTLKVGQPLDREAKAQHLVLVSLMKNGALVGMATIIVNVLDINDNIPNFLGVHPFNLTVRENKNIGDTLLTASGQDDDAGNNSTLTYEIVSGNMDGTFAINNQTGAIFLSRSLDRENTEHYVLTIRVKDDGIPSLNSTTTVNINVDDVNDNAPVMQPAVVTASVSEAAGSGTSVTTITASDADIGSNARLIYAIESGGHEDFTINNDNGLISTYGTLSYNLRRRYTLIVNATDSGAPSLSVRGVVEINVIMTSTNSHRPQFSASSYIGGVHKVTTDNFEVLAVKATDADSGTNGEIVYNIASSGTQGLFYIESSTGDINTANTFLDREEGQSYSFSVRATDKGSPPKLSQPNAQVTIFLLRQSYSVVLHSELTQHYILQNYQEFNNDLSELSGGAVIIIKSVRTHNTNQSVITVNGVKNLAEMSYEQLNEALLANRNESKYTKWKFINQGADVPSTAALTEDDGDMPAMVGALICLSVLIGVGGIVMIFILWKKRRDEVLPRKQSRVTFNDKPLYIDPVGTSAGERPDPAQEAQEVIVHMDDDASSNGSEHSTTDENVINFTNHAYQRDTSDSDDESERFGSTEAGEIPNFGTFFPPPPTTPPPPVPNSDDEESNDYDDVDVDETATERSYIAPYEYGNNHLDYKLFSPKGEEDSTNYPADGPRQILEPQSYRDALLHDPFFAFNVENIDDNKTTEL